MARAGSGVATRVAGGDSGSEPRPHPSPLPHPPTHTSCTGRTVTSHKHGFCDDSSFWFEMSLVWKDASGVEFFLESLNRLTCRGGTSLLTARPAGRSHSDKRNLGAPTTVKLVILQGVMKAWPRLQRRAVHGHCPTDPAPVPPAPAPLQGCQPRRPQPTGQSGHLTTVDTPDTPPWAHPTARGSPPTLSLSLSSRKHAS